MPKMAQLVKDVVCLYVHDSWLACIMSLDCQDHFSSSDVTFSYSQDAKFSFARALLYVNKLNLHLVLIWPTANLYAEVRIS